RDGSPARRSSRHLSRRRDRRRRQRRCGSAQPRRAAADGGGGGGPHAALEQRQPRGAGRSAGAASCAQLKSMTFPETTERTPPPRLAVVGVQFRTAGTIHEYDAGTLLLRCGDRVVVQVNRGTSLATVAVAPRQVDAGAASALPRVIKK